MLPFLLYCFHGLLTAGTNAAGLQESTPPLPLQKAPHSNKRSSHGQTAVCAVYPVHSIELKISVLANK